MEDVKAAVVKFTKDRDWDQFHSPENLAKSVSIEAGELLECFQWSDRFDREDVCEELADVLTYCIMLADKLDIDIEQIIVIQMEERKTERNEQEEQHTKQCLIQ